MKTSSTPEHDPSLDRVLRRWVVGTPLPRAFEQQVWARIRRAEMTAPASLWGRLVNAVEVVLPRPKVAWSYLSAILALGIVTGSWTAQVRSSRLHSALSERYVQTLDPYRTGPSQP